MVLDVSKGLVDFLPSQLTVANGDTFSISWFHGDVRHEDATPPYGTFSPISTVLERRRDMSLEGNPEEIFQNQIDNITFNDGTLEYDVTQPDIDTINTVTGTLGGSGGHTFVEDTDFQVITADDYITPSTIEWLTSGDNPDDGTTFTVDYDHRLIRPKRRTFERLTYRLGVHGKHHSSGEGSATRPYNGADLAAQLGDALTEHFTKNKGALMIEDTDARLRFTEFESYGSMNIEEGDATHVNIFDIVMSRTSDVALDDTEVIGKINTSTTTET